MFCAGHVTRFFIQYHFIYKSESKFFFHNFHKFVSVTSKNFLTFVSRTSSVLVIFFSSFHILIFVKVGIFPSFSGVFFFFVIVLKRIHEILYLDVNLLWRGSVLSSDLASMFGDIMVLVSCCLLLDMLLVDCLLTSGLELG